MRSYTIPISFPDMATLLQMYIPNTAKVTGELHTSVEGKQCQYDLRLSVTWDHTQPYKVTSFCKVCGRDGVAQCMDNIRKSKGQ